MTITNEYRCAAHGLFALREPCNDAEDPRSCPTCGAPSPYTISAVVGRVQSWSVSTGSSERPPWALDTRAIADGQATGEWKRETAEKIHTEHRDRVLKELG